MELTMTKTKTHNTWGNPQHPFRVWAADFEETNYYHFPNAAEALSWALTHEADELTGIFAYGLEERDGEGWCEWYDEDGDDLCRIVDRIVYDE